MTGKALTMITTGMITITTILLLLIISISKLLRELSKRSRCLTEKLQNVSQTP